MTMRKTTFPRAVTRLLQKAGRDPIARKVAMLDVHDDELISVRITKPRARRGKPALEFELGDDTTGDVKLLSFPGVANLRFSMDFDVLRQNWFAQTDGLSCAADVAWMKRFVRSQKKEWRTQYMGRMNRQKPIRSKLAAIRNYRRFTLKFYGGTAEILAKDLRIRTVRGK